MNKMQKVIAVKSFKELSVEDQQKLPKSEHKKCWKVLFLTPIFSGDNFDIFFCLSETEYLPDGVRYEGFYWNGNAEDCSEYGEIKIKGKWRCA